MCIYIYIHTYMDHPDFKSHACSIYKYIYIYIYIRKTHKHSRRWQVRHSHMCSECFLMTWFYHNVYEWNCQTREVRSTCHFHATDLPKLHYGDKWRQIATALRFLLWVAVKEARLMADFVSQGICSKSKLAATFGQQDVLQATVI